ncbi:hypothetical protein D3C75_750680 [compost metagenome]
MQTLCCTGRILAVNGVDLKQSEVAFILFGCAAFAGNKIAASEIKLANLRSRDINIFRTGQIVDRP